LTSAPSGTTTAWGAPASTRKIVNTFPDLSLDVDGSGAVEASVDVLNIFRVLAGAPQAVVVPDGADVSQQDIVNAVNELLA
ncbi:MAG: hypothetical protein AAFY11_09380, partial [Cyanobacteria bacterium J06641_5]